MEDLVTVATFRFALQAEMARVALQQEGIQAFVNDSNLVATNWFLGNAIGFVKLQVPQSQAEAAAAFLERQPDLLDQARGESIEEEDDGVARCLSCNAELPAESDCCPACGWSYDQGDDETSE